MRNKDAIREIRKYVATLALDDQWDKDACVVLLSSAIVGPNVQRLTKFTNLPTRVVADVGSLCRRHGIWKGGKVRAEWMGPNGGMALVCDLCVLRGLLQRA